MTKIVIADDQALFREGLRTLLSIRPDMDVVGEAANGDEAVALVEALRPNVVLMDLRMPRLDGVQVTARIRERWPEIPVLVLTTFDDDANLFGALKAGAAGYLLTCPEVEMGYRVCKPRRPRDSPLYRLVGRHLEELLRDQRAAWRDGAEAGVTCLQRRALSAVR